MFEKTSDRGALKILKASRGQKRSLIYDFRGSKLILSIGNLVRENPKAFGYASKLDQ